jgi:hypothetical protein
MATDWDTVRNAATQAAEGLLTNVWGTVANGAIASITSLIESAKYIEDNLANMTPDEGKFLIAQQKTAMQNVLLAYQDIGWALAINVVNAVITAIINAAPKLIGFV